MTIDQIRAFLYQEFPDQRDEIDDYVDQVTEHEDDDVIESTGREDRKGDYLLYRKMTRVH